MFLANRIIKKDKGLWTEELREHTTYTESQLRSCAKDMCILIAGIEKCSLQTVRKKFSLSRYHQVATIKIEHWMTLKTESDKWMSQIRGNTWPRPARFLLTDCTIYKSNQHCLSVWRQGSAKKTRTTSYTQDWPISQRVSRPVWTRIWVFLASQRRWLSTKDISKMMWWNLVL